MTIRRLIQPYVKFGANPDIDTGTAPEPIAWSSVSLVWPTVAAIGSIVSSSANDTAAGTGARTIYVEGVRAGDYVEIGETIVMNGLTPVATVNTYWRINRAYVVTAGSLETNAGTITVTMSGQTVCVIGLDGTVGQGQTLICAWTVPYRAGYTCLFNGYFLTANNGGVFRLRRRISGTSPWRTHRRFSTPTGGGMVSMQYPRAQGMEVAPGEDWEARCVSVVNNNTAVEAEMHFEFVKNEWSVTAGL